MLILANGDAARSAAALRETGVRGPIVFGSVRLAVCVPYAAIDFTDVAL